MSLVLGVDTGGTYTDAVLLRGDREIIATAKSLTTRDDLARGIGAAVESVLSSSGCAPEAIGLASLSTTLATNALVEGQGGRVGLVLAGFSEADLERHGLADALSGDPCLILAGGHDHAGNEVAALDSDAVLDWVRGAGREVSAYAVATRFATRNPAHEQALENILRDSTGRAVSCSHHLSARLNGPKRALTAVLNARLIGMIERLISRAEARLAELGIAAPLMVVRGDGALVSAGFARSRPIETILSGPAASIVGARWLTDVDDAIVSDIGGTTTDVAVLRAGRPQIDPDGAQVGGFRTMVEAVAMRTHGLGGDSEVHVRAEGLAGGVTLGPRRVVPVALAAEIAPGLVHDVLEMQARRETPSEMDGRFAIPVPEAPRDGLEPRVAALLDRIGSDVVPLDKALKTRRDHGALRQLVSRGLVQVAGVTPTDAAHVLGWSDAFDRAAAESALQMLARRRTGAGTALAKSAVDLAEMVVAQVTEQTSLAVLETAFANEDLPFDAAPQELARHALLRAALDGHRGMLRLDAGLNQPLIGLGASAPRYYPAVGERLNAETILPEHAGVANAIGAVVGRVTVRRSGTVTAPSEGCFRVHLAKGVSDFADEAAALTALESDLRSAVLSDADAAGAEDVQVHVARDLRRATVEERQVFVEGTITVEASGRPRITQPA